MQDVQATSQKAKKSKQSVGQVLLHALAPDTQQLLQQLHEQGRIADHELDTVCYTRLAATAPELQVAVSAPALRINRHTSHPSCAM